MLASVELPPDEVHVWVASVDGPEEDLATLTGMLPADELRWAGRLRFERDRRRFIVRRAILRTILAAYVGREAGDLGFRRGRSGKPALAGGEVEFSCSHSQGLAVWAVSRARRVGVDVERLRPVAGAAAIADSLFAPAERAALLALAPGERDAAFLRCWTRKEACVKASGEGLGRALDSFSVSLLAACVPPAVERVTERGVGAARWSLQAFAPAPGYVAAVAAERPPWRMRCRQW